MKKNLLRTYWFFLVPALLVNLTSHSQESISTCKVEVPNLKGAYTGDCRNGLAHGKGAAIGIHRYTGQFRNGLPDGQGVYYYSDSIFHTGTFQDGIREGKGETHFVRTGMVDSIVKGYWSGDSYRGKNYITYTATDIPVFDRVEITPSKESGNTLAIEVATTSGAIKGSPDFTTGSNRVLTITEVIPLDGNFIRKLDIESGLKFRANYELTKFPARLRIVLSNGQSFNLELFKAAKWNVYLFLNK